MAPCRSWSTHKASRVQKESKHIIEFVFRLITQINNKPPAQVHKVFHKCFMHLKCRCGMLCFSLTMLIIALFVWCVEHACGVVGPGVKAGKKERGVFFSAPGSSPFIKVCLSFISTQVKCPENYI